MDNQPRTIRLEPIHGKEKQHQQTSHKMKNKKSLSGKFRLTSNLKMKTEPSDQSFHQSHYKFKKEDKGKNSFSEEYISLVNKLRVNLSKEYFQRKKSRQFMKEKQSFYNDENSDRYKNFSVGSRKVQKPHFILKKPLVSSRKHLQVKTGYKQEDIVVNPLTQKNLSQERVIQLSRLRLSYQRKQQRKYSGSNERLIKHERKLSDNKQIGVLVKRTKMSEAQKKFGMLRQQRKKLLIRYPEKQVHVNLQSQRELDCSYQQFDQLCFHTEILLGIYSALNQSEKDDNLEELLLKKLKGYVMGNKKLVQKSGIIIMDDISHIEVIFIEEAKQKSLKNMVFMQRILIIIIVDLIVWSKLSKHLTQINLILSSLIGLYLYLIYTLKQHKGQLQNQELFNHLQSNLAKHAIHLKKQIIPLNAFIFKKLNLIMKANINLSKQLKVLIGQFQSRNVSINRSFYQLLKLYAIYLNNHEQLIDSHQHIMKSFATCPSPYLTKNSPRKYTLVLDLDQTLMYVTESKKKIEVLMRPYTKEFLELMGSYFEIVIFTSSMPSYSQDLIKTLPQISHSFYRYHTTRLKSRHVKDLGRLGRSLSKMVIIDNEQQNFMLHKENGIKISEWRGNNPVDQDLNIIGLFLSNMVKQDVEDVREYLAGYREFRKQYY